MERIEYLYSPDFKLRIFDISRELEFKNSSVLRKELVELNVLWHDKAKKRYELTESAIKCGLGEIRTKTNSYSNFTSHFNVFNVQEMVNFLNRGIPLGE